MVKISNASYENEIHRVDSLFNEDSKNIIFFQGGPNFGEGQLKNLWKMAKNKETYCMQIREWSILILAYTPWY